VIAEEFTASPICRVRIVATDSIIIMDLKTQTSALIAKTRQVKRNSSPNHTAWRLEWGR
jgi:hypothetical protein